jgi:hypothetical protein
VEANLQKCKKGLPKVHQPLPLHYHPDLDITPLLQDDEINLYQSHVSILKGIVELGCLDVYVHVAFMSSFLASPRVGHLEALYYILDT